MGHRLRSGFVASLAILGFALILLGQGLASSTADGSENSKPGDVSAVLAPGVAAPPPEGSSSFGLLSVPIAWPDNSLKAVGKVIQREDGSVSPGDILSFYVCEQDGYQNFRVSLVSMRDLRSGEEIFLSKSVRAYVLIDNRTGGKTSLPDGLEGEAPFAWDELVEISPRPGMPGGRPGTVRVRDESQARETVLDGRFLNVAGSSDALLASVPSGAISGAISSQESNLAQGGPEKVTRYFVLTVSGNTILDTLSALDPSPLTYEANVAFAHHGNQGLGHSDVFHGRYGAEGESGFDETLEKHQATGIPGNFELSPLLQTSQLWDHNCGDVMDFNGWLATGVTQGWAGIVSSAYAQHIMPFVQNSMNDWAVNIATQMGSTRYGYYPRVAWVPERVWLSPSSYPSAGVSDWIGDNWTNNGVYAVILDDDVHGTGYDNHQIHTMSGSTLKVILRDSDFTGKMHAGDGAGALAILQNLASSGNGTYRIVTYADDWEMVAAMGEWAQSMPYAKGTYEWMIDKCVSESSWLHAWKLADALSNPNFNGSSSMNVTNGTYWGIGGTNGYGGNNNAWYTHWAGYIPYANGGDGNGNCAGSGGNCKNYGTLWDDAYDALMAAPNNNISQAGWYVLMTNLHETGWHDYMGGPISDWEKKYSSHIKNANTYAEASRWAAGLYVNPTGAYPSDIDNDGYSELVMYNDRVFAVFEPIGGRAVNVFAKGPDYNFSVIGVDNAYWYGTEADYNDGNHVGALSDVGPNYQHSPYSVTIQRDFGDTVQATFQCEGIKKIVKLSLGEPYLDVIYYTGGTQTYIQTGFSPDLVDLVWNANLSRIWVSDVAYMGQRNPNTGATGAYVVGTGGASHVKDFTGTIMKGDEITGKQAFELYVYAGKTSAPDGQGRIAELEVLADSLYDKVRPEVVSASYFPGQDQLSIEFTEDINYQQVTVTGIAVDDDNDGVAEVTLGNDSHVTNTADGPVIVVAVASATAAQIEALNTSNMRLLLAANAAYDSHGNPNLVVTNLHNKMISYGPPTIVAIDGHVNVSGGEWPSCAMAVPDSNDSQWTSANEIDALYVTMDSTYLYLALDGKVTANSWIIYLDTDPGGPNGETDLSNIDHWERGAMFTAPGFRADWEYGCYQHQGQYDSDSFWKITSPTTSVAYSDSILSAFDSMHNYGDAGGSELAIPWNVLFGLGQGVVPANCSISIVASLCWDPEPSGVLGGDSAPNNISAVLPTIDKVFTFVVDANGDGTPDLPDKTPPTLASAQSMGDTLVSLVFSESVTSSTAEDVANYSAYETLVPGNHLAILDATLQGDGKTVILRTAQQLPLSYTLLVSGVQDTSCYENQISPNSSIQFDGETTSVPGEPKPVVDRLHQNFPNPFNPLTTIELSLAGSAHVRLTIFDPQGRIVRTLADANLGAGVWRFLWNGVSEDGKVCSSGVYFYSVESNRIRETKKMILLR